VTSTKRVITVLTGSLAAGLLAAPAVIGSPAQAQRPAEYRTSIAPNVMFPVIAGKARDLRTSGRRPGTEIKAKCGKPVRAATPGTAVVTASKHSGPALVRIVTSNSKLTTWYGYMSSAAVTTGQIIQAGQRIGVVGRTGDARMCSLYFAVTSLNGAKTYNPSRWLTRHVGKPFGAPDLFNNRGFVVASFNTLGASHTTNSRTYPSYAIRTPKQISLLNAYGVDVVGLQEFQRKQYDTFLTAAGRTFGIYPDPATLADPTAPFMVSNYGPTENSIIWRNSTMEFVSADYIEVPYFQSTRNMPVVLLRNRATGQTAYFINVHNPASGVGYGDQSANRRAAIAVERQKIIELRATGRPVFLTGDFNDRAAAFCPMTAGMLTISPDSIPSMTCAAPPAMGIDWIFTAGPARFSRYARDWQPKNLRLSDHPIVWTRAHLSE
jgi:endonuclease/exonuclease/phosphatase family metal-dependent hydrolase